MDPHRLLSEWLRTTFPAGPPSPADRSVPPFILPDHEGWLVSSAKMQAQGAYVLAFFHGSWCITCRAMLTELQSGLHRIHEVVDEPRQSFVERRDGIGRRAQHRIAEIAERADGHGTILGNGINRRRRSRRARSDDPSSTADPISRAAR